MGRFSEFFEVAGACENDVSSSEVSKDDKSINSCSSESLEVSDIRSIFDLVLQILFNNLIRNKHEMKNKELQTSESEILHELQTKIDR